MDHELDWEPVPEPSASPFVGLDALGARRLSSLRAPDSSTDTDDPRPGGPASDSSSDIDDGPILARRAERNSVSERRKLTFSTAFDGPQPPDAAEPQQAYPLPPAAPPPGVVGHTPVPVGGPDHAVVEAALQALHRPEQASPGGDGDEHEEGRGLVYLDSGVEEELEDLRAQVQADAEALEVAQEEKWALTATVQALEAQVAALNSKLQEQQQAPPPVPESETLAALRKDVQELEHLLAASQKENERATLAVKEARQEAALKVAAAEAEASAVRAELAVIRTETQLAGKPAAAAVAPVAAGAGEGGDAHLPPTAGQLRRILALEAALGQVQEAGAAKERAAAAEAEALREQLDAAQRQLVSRHSDSSRAHMREAAAARAAAAVARTSMTTGGGVGTSAAAGADVHVVADVVADALTQAPPARMNEKLLRQLRAEHEAVRAAYEDRLAVSEAAAAKGVAAAARVRALERELTEARAHASRRVRAVQEEAETAARERDVVVQELDAIRKEAAAAKRREVDILRRERDAKAKCMAAEEAAARAKEDLRDVTHRLQMLETAQHRLQQREEQQPAAEVAPPAAAAPRRSSSAGAARQRAAPPPQAQQHQSRSASDDVTTLQRKLEAAQMSLQAMARSHGEAVEKAAAARLESEKALWQLQTAHAERLDALHKDKLTLEAELKALLSATGVSDGSSSNPASHDDVRYALAAAARRADAADQRAAQLEVQLRSSRHMRGGAAHLDGLAARIAAAEAAASKLASRVEAREAECRALIREVARLEALTGREEHRSGEESTLEDLSRALDARKVEVTRFRAALDAVLEGAAARWEPDGAADSRQGAAA